VSLSIEQSYTVCRKIARSEAKNFYYAFLVLPRHKRSAMCAMYAFMRHADDLADDESIPLEERRQRAAAWLEEWHRVAAGAVTENPVFLAVRDVQQRFAISNELLDQLVQGTMMDLMPQPENGRGVGAELPQETEDASSGHPFLVYRTFDDLYRYCYYVASVVGLVCIRVFGYQDARAEKLAEETGIAFQLTNILRDVREDAERGRVYLPLEDLRRYGLTAEEVAAMRGDAPMSLAAHSLLEMEAQRARKYYAAAEALLPMISPDSRPALWVLVAVYRRLLEHITARRYQVFSGKIKVPTHEKIAILLRGLWMVLRARLLSRA
jgi:phytoene synthase